MLVQLMPTNLRCVGRGMSGTKYKVSVLVILMNTKYTYLLVAFFCSEEQSIIPAILLAWNMAKALKITEKELHSSNGTE